MNSTSGGNPRERRPPATGPAPIAVDETRPRSSCPSVETPDEPRPRPHIMTTRRAGRVDNAGRSPVSGPPKTASAPALVRSSTCEPKSPRRARCMPGLRRTKPTRAYSARNNATPGSHEAPASGPPSLFAIFHARSNDPSAPNSRYTSKRVERVRLGLTKPRSRAMTHSNRWAHAEDRTARPQPTDEGTTATTAHGRRNHATTAHGRRNHSPRTKEPHATNSHQREPTAKARGHKETRGATRAPADGRAAKTTTKTTDHSPQNPHRTRDTRA